MKSPYRRLADFIILHHIYIRRNLSWPSPRRRRRQQGLLLQKYVETAGSAVIMTDTNKVISAAPPTRAQKRSWSGCTRCKRRRQKCDEGRPSCNRCASAKIEDECVYEVKLRWGGRSFNQSRFGERISGSFNRLKKLGMIYVKKWKAMSNLR